jgi:hypothetical protein
MKEGESAARKNSQNGQVTTEKREFTSSVLVKGVTLT